MKIRDWRSKLGAVAARGWRVWSSLGFGKSERGPRLMRGITVQCGAPLAEENLWREELQPYRVLTICPPRNEEMN